MTNGRPQPGPIEQRLAEVTAYRPTHEERRIIETLLDVARRPFGTGRPIGDDPATQFFPVQSEASPFDPAG